MATATETKSDSSVAELQRVLATYATITGFTPANPGKATGIVDMPTVMAVVAILPKVPKLPKEVIVLPAIVALYAATDDGKKQLFDLVKAYAGSVSKAIIALEVYQVGSGSVVPVTPVKASVKSGTIFNQAGAMIMQNLATGTVATAGGIIPGNPALAIWFYDNWSKSYRIAVPMGSLAGYSNYVEVSTAVSKPAQGTEVNRSTFMSATGKWWLTTGGMAAVAGGVVGLGALTFATVRSIFR